MKKWLWIFLLVSFSLSAVGSNPGESKSSPDAVKAITGHLNEIRKTFASGIRSGEMRDHARASFNFVVYLYQTPLQTLIPLHHLFVQAVESDGGLSMFE